MLNHQTSFLQIVQQQKSTQINQKPQKIKVRKFRNQHWSPRQQKIYLQYLRDNMNIMSSEALRREKKVFRQISIKLKTRDCIQVKSHHQKLQKKYGKTQVIIQQLEEYLTNFEISQAPTQTQQRSAQPIKQDQNIIFPFLQTYQNFELKDEQLIQDFFSLDENNSKCIVGEFFDFSIQQQPLI